MQHVGKLLAFILRHKPDVAGGADNHGWVDVTSLLVAINKQYFPLTMQQLIDVVNDDDKQRYAFNADKTMIRAVQGHSFKVDLELVATKPPDKLFHGTVLRNAESIEMFGLSKQRRQHVHMTDNIDVAYKVGERYHDQVVICIIDAKQMFEDGYDFYVAENNVWLTDKVPPQYILQVLMEDRSDIQHLKDVLN